jgi:hypothetical protein
LDEDAGCTAFDPKNSAMRPFTGTVRELINAGVQVDDSNAQGETGKATLACNQDNESEIHVFVVELIIRLEVFN